MRDKKTEKIVCWLWVISTLVVCTAMSLFPFFYSAGLDPGEDKVLKYLAHQSSAQRLWQLEFLGMTGMGIAATWFAVSEKSLWWVLVAFGQICIIVSYPIMLGGYPMAAAAYQEVPALMDTLNQIAVNLYAICNVIFCAGFAGILLTTSLFPKWLAGISGLLALVVMAGAFLIFLEFQTFDSLGILGPMILVLYLLLAWYGFRRIRTFSTDTK